MAYHFTYVSKHDPEVQKRHTELCTLIREVQNQVRKKFTFQYKFIGSYSRNMITWDSKSNIGYDFDVNIEPNLEEIDCSPKEIMSALQNALNKSAPKFGFDPPEASTSVLTIKVKDKKHSRILFSCDFAVVDNYEDDDGNERQEYIRFNKKQNAYQWCERGEGYYMLPEKIKWLKENDLWGEMRELYIVNKNDVRNKSLHSRTVFANTVHQVCQKNGFFDYEDNDPQTPIWYGLHT